MLLIYRASEDWLRKIIGIAAPARSGKDTVASLLLEQAHVVAYALADPLKIGCQTLFGLTDEETWQDEVKETRIALWERSPREFFQHVGTDWMRAHNPDHWLQRAERLIKPASVDNHSPSTSPVINRQAPFHWAAQAFFGLSDQQTWDSRAADRLEPFWNMTPQQMFQLIESLTLRDFPDYFAQRSQRPNVAPSRQLPLLGTADVIIIKDIRFENEADYLRRHNGSIWHIQRKAADKVNPHASELGIKIGANDVLIDNNGTLEQLALAVKTAWQNHLHDQP